MLTTTEVATLARVSRDTVVRAITEGDLAAVRTGRIYSVAESDAEEWARTHEPYAGLKVSKATRGDSRPSEYAGGSERP
jgi:excisionase family DNA binding protein